jgi:hypothetical protein
MLKLTCAAEIKRQDSGLPLAIFAQAFHEHLKNKKSYLRDLLTYAYDRIAVLMVYNI